MKNMARLTTILGLLSALMVATPGLAQSQPARAVLPSTQPNTTFTVGRHAGTCPKTVRLWTSSTYYEGGGELTVIADTLAIAGTAKLVSSSQKFAQYRAPLKKAYASCVGRASSQEYPQYRFRFQKGNVYFTVQLPPDNPSTPSVIMNRSILGSRPYVRWAIAD